MHALHLLTGKVFLDAQVEADQRKRNAHGLAVGIRLLRGKCVDDVLVDEGWIVQCVRKRVAAELVVRLFLRCHRKVLLRYSADELLNQHQGTTA